MARAPSWNGLRTSSESLRAQRRRLVAEYLAMPPDSARGTYEYANAGFVVAGAMLEEVTGRAWEDLMRERVFGPLGMSGASLLRLRVGRRPGDRPSRGPDPAEGLDQGQRSSLRALSSDWCHDAVVRTTLTLEDDLARALREEARRSGRPLKRAI
jgi:CubicO group peptidase (beta-lactamase class C family)